MMAFYDNAILISFSFRESMSFYNIKDERNPWHKAWCLVISLVTKVLQVVSYKENFVEQVRKQPI